MSSADDRVRDPINEYPYSEKRSVLPCSDHDKRITLTEQAVMSIKQTNEGLTTKMDLLLAQMTKVALLEEKHITQQADLTRAHSKIELQSKALDELGRESRAFMNYTQGRDKVLWTLAGTVAILLIKVLFFAANNGMTP